MNNNRLSAERLANYRVWAATLDADDIARQILAELDAVTREKEQLKAELEEARIIIQGCGIGLAGMNFITNRERGSK